MSFLSTLLSQNHHQVPTRQALMIMGLQNDFTSPDGKLPVNNSTGYLDRIRQLVPVFREHGEVLWIRTEYKENRPVNDPSGSGCMVVADDEVDVSAIDGGLNPADYSSRPSIRSSRRINEIVQRTMNRAAELGLEPLPVPAVDQDLFLSQAKREDNCCLPGSWGAELSPEIQDLISPKDVKVVKSYYSAFTSSTLLLMLRAKLITELYVVGCTTNLSVYATALDAAQHGMTINLVEDCLNYRHKERHERAMQRLVDMMGASVTTSASVICRLGGNSSAEDQTLEAATGDSDTSIDDQTGPVRETPLVEIIHDQTDRTRLSETSTLAAHRADQRTSLEHAEPTGSEPPNSTDTGHRGASSSESERNTRRRFQPSLAPVNTKSKQSVTDQSLTEGSTTRDKDSSASSSLLEPDDLQKPHDIPPVASLNTRSSPPPSQTDNNTTLTRHLRSIGPELSPSISETLSSHDAVDSPIRVQRKPQVRRKDRSALSKPLGPEDEIGSGDSRIVFGLLESSVADVVFQQLFHEVHWQRMYHAAGEVPRLVCCQGDINLSDGSMPVYRHPADQSLPLLQWSPTVVKIKRKAEERVGHKLNHVLIQLYRSGQDHISEHSDKTLDIVRGSNIVNVSIGAQRTMRLRTKRTEPGRTCPSAPNKRQAHDVPGPASSTPTSRTTQRITMPHNSMLVMGPKTNSTWLHGIAPDKRIIAERSPAELAYGGMRISLTFRHIGTFLSADSKSIWGQGAVAKSITFARPTINGQEEESQSLINAFGFENQSTKFDWEATYGAGFDVLHLESALPEREKPMLFLSGREHSDLPVKMFLSHLSIDVDIVDPPPDITVELVNANGGSLPATGTRREICFRHAGPLHAQVEGELAILLFLDSQHHASNSAGDEASLTPQRAREMELLTSSTLIESQAAVVHRENPSQHDTITPALQKLEDVLLAVSERTHDSDEGYVGTWLAGPGFGIADCAFWPLIRDLRSDYPDFSEAFPMLEKWARRIVLEKEKMIHGEGN